MSTRERWLVYGVGFLIGCLLLMTIRRMKVASEQTDTPPATFQQEKGRMEPRGALPTV